MTKFVFSFRFDKGSRHLIFICVGISFDQNYFDPSFYLRSLIYLNKFIHKYFIMIYVWNHTGMKIRLWDGASYRCMNDHFFIESVDMHNDTSGTGF